MLKINALCSELFLECEYKTSLKVKIKLIKFISHLYYWKSYLFCFRHPSDHQTKHRRICSSVCFLSSRNLENWASGYLENRESLSPVIIGIIRGKQRGISGKDERNNFILHSVFRNLLVWHFSKASNSRQQLQIKNRKID